MDYTLKTLIDTLRKRLQDEDFDEELLKHFINQSQSEILGEDKYPFMQRIDQYEAEEAGEINLPPFYAGTFYIYAKKPGQPRQELHFIEPEEYFKNTARHTMVYTVFANTIFYKIYEGAENSDFRITHLYLTNPLPLVKDTDRTPIPEQYIEALLLGALYRAEQVRDNFDFAQIYQNEQDQILTNMKLRYGPGNLTAQNVAKLPFNQGVYDDRI